MSGAEAVLESAILAALGADAGVTSVLGDPLRVLDNSSTRPAFPYLEVSRHSSESSGGVEAETSEHRVDLVIVSREMDGMEAKEALARVRAALADAALEMEGWRCVLLVPVFADAMRQKVGQWRGLLRIKAVVEPV